MSEFKQARSVVDVINEIIARENESYDFHIKAAKEIGDEKAKTCLTKFAELQRRHCQQLQECLGNIQSQMDIDRSIMSSFDQNYEC